MVDQFVKQLDGCIYYPGGNNCSCAAEASLLYRATQGRVSTTACHVRSLTGDRSGGTNLDQMKTVSEHYGVNVGALWRPGRFSALKSLLLTNSYPVIAQIGYAPLAGTANDCFRGQFRGGHAIYIKGASATGIRYGDPGADGRYAGCPNGWQSMSWSMFERATYALPLGNGLTLGGDYGSGYVFAYIGPRDPIPASTTWRVHIDAPDPPRFALLDRPFGTKKQSVTKATYRCSLGPKLKSPTNGLLYAWYRIETKVDGSQTANHGLVFTPNRYVEAERL